MQSATTLPAPSDFATLAPSWHAVVGGARTRVQRCRPPCEREDRRRHRPYAGRFPPSGTHDFEFTMYALRPAAGGSRLSA
jgi:hypothetical protein